MSSIKLTSRQQQILDLIKTYLDSHGYPPTRAEIATHFGFRSPNASEAHLKALARKGAIEMIPSASRGIRLPNEPEPAPAAKAPASSNSHKKSQPNNRSANDEASTEDLAIIGRVAAGSPILASAQSDERAPISPDFFRPRADYLLRVQGLSMKDIGIFEDDLIAVHRTQVARHGDIVVARLDDEVTVKRLSQRHGRVELQPENTDLKPILVQPGQHFAIEGICVGVIRKH